MAREPEQNGRYNLPSRANLEKVASRQPSLLNILLAYFYFEWLVVELSSTPYGNDQTGKRRIVPDFVRMYGVDRVMGLLRECPGRRTPTEPGGLTFDFMRSIP